MGYTNVQEHLAGEFAGKTMNNLESYLLDWHADSEGNPDPDFDLFRVTAAEFEAEENNTDFDLLKSQLLESDLTENLMRQIALGDTVEMLNVLAGLEALQECNMSDLITRRVNSIDLSELSQ